MRIKEIGHAQFQFHAAVAGKNMVFTRIEITINGFAKGLELFASALRPTDRDDRIRQTVMNIHRGRQVLVKILGRDALVNQRRQVDHRLGLGITNRGQELGVLVIVAAHRGIQESGFNIRANGQHF